MRRGASARAHARGRLRSARGGAGRRGQRGDGGGAHGLSGEVVIRPADVADAEAIGRVHVAAWRAGHAGLVPDDLLARVDPDERAAHWRDRIPDTIALVAEYDGALAGFTSLAIPARDSEPALKAAGEITTLYVEPERWRRGIGRALVDAAAAELRDDGCDLAVLWVYEANTAARAFYGALGFEPDGARKTDPFAGLPEVRLRARLD